MDILVYEARRNWFLKCESELDAIVELIASGEGEVSDHQTRLEQALNSELETYQQYREARKAIIDRLIGQCSPPARPLAGTLARLTPIDGFRLVSTAANTGFLKKSA